MSYARHLLDLVNKFATITDQHLFQQELSNKLTKILNHGKLPYIDYTGDHTVFEHSTNYEVNVLLMQSPNSDAFRKNHSPDLSNEQFFHMIKSFIRDMKSILPHAKLETSSEPNDSCEMMNISFYISK